LALVLAMVDLSCYKQVQSWIAKAGLNVSVKKIIFHTCFWIWVSTYGSETTGVYTTTLGIFPTLQISLTSTGTSRLIQWECKMFLRR